MRIRVVLYLLCFLMPLSCTTNAADTKEKLSNVIAQIKNVQLLLSKRQSEKEHFQKKLQQTELAINQMSLRLDFTTKQLSNQQLKINRLLNEREKILQAINQEQLLLLKNIRLAYTLGLKKKSQLILETNDIHKLNRLLIYNRYLALKQQTLLLSLRNKLQQLETNKKEVISRSDYLLSIRQDLSVTQKKLDSNKKNQLVMLSELASEVKTETNQLNELLKNKKNLENVLTTLQTKESYCSDFLSHHSGKFPWPTKGNIIEKFGSYIQHSELKQNGVLIKAPEGQKVYAVAPGKVIFANWMPGYGMLMIIDHGKGYMTLYGNNSILYKKAKATVTDHELIASVGHTGGQQQSALYFALRKKGKAVDPATWCS